MSNITANHSVLVTFTLLTFTVTPSSDGNGTISPSSAQTVNYGSSLTFTATPNTGYTVNTWPVDGTVRQTGGTTFTLSNITANHSVEVTFTLLDLHRHPIVRYQWHDQPEHRADGELRQQPHLHRDPEYRLHGEHLVGGWHGAADRRHHLHLE